jgi:hypothetical protein
VHDEIHCLQRDVICFQHLKTKCAFFDDLALPSINRRHLVKGMTKIAGISKEDIKSEFGEDAHLFLESEV